MLLFPRRLAATAIAAAALLFGGCDLWTRSGVDERHEPNFIAASNYVLQGDVDEAVRAFYRALEANPNNATAHQELGLLFQDKKHEYVMSVYHLRRCQMIRAQRHENDPAGPRRAQLATAIEYSSSLGQRRAADEAEVLKRRNAELEAQIGQLTRQLNIANQAAQRAAQNPAPVESGPIVLPPQTNPAPATTNGERPPVPGAVVPENPPGHAVSAGRGAAGATGRGSKSEANHPSAKAAPRTHSVKPGETPAIIARKYGLTTKQLMDANPGLDPRRLHKYQVINLPEHH
jgi:LysM repeat protein